MGCVAPLYRPRDAEHTVLHQVVAEHLEAFLGAVAAAGDGAGLPQFVEREFRDFLLSGVYEAGVARFQCEGCAREHLVPFSCKGRGFCPSCAVGSCGFRGRPASECGRLRHEDREPRTRRPPPESRSCWLRSNLVLLYGVIFVLINLLVDISYGWFDPRIRYQ
jgi:hypothetical protein